MNKFPSRGTENDVSILRGLEHVNVGMEVANADFHSRPIIDFRFRNKVFSLLT